ncbi:HD domain-containing protein [Fulvivirga sediminis]|uniref:Bifunctional (P)ppGpp synthetase/guanosine-3',5'-bis(Diphosphate) 3'-pyrophosphohydrolase n=1 Tax=Fulvivirga sediminis TaxID=2803949 RepID=A0A937F5Q0_9BACT|nr:HD domain-containing protein [Fulvivirga sediminis]MBL3654498.1 bifunctional (p)ppGpp synthetase/guanosine-3',5'-bis(diphosphate) 3'-pyrophosphohydrolase [Fulvivirga sediminis]
MIQEIYQRAMKFAGEKHSAQKVPGTEANYLLHISNVAMEVIMAYHYNGNFDLTLAIQVAILHDTLEDTETTYQELVQEFGDKVAQGVQALTKNADLSSKKERMEDSLLRVSQLGREVGLVKLADRITNLQKPPGHWSSDKINGYLAEAQLINEVLSDKNEYLNNRLAVKIKEYQNYL